MQRLIATLVLVPSLAIAGVTADQGMASPRQFRTLNVYVKSQHDNRWGLAAWERVEKHAEVRALVREGLSLLEVARRTGLCDRTVGRIAAAAKLEHTRVRPLTDEERERIRALGRQKVAMNVIAQRLGRSPSAVRRVLVKAGIHFRRRNEIWPGDHRFGHICFGNGPNRE